MHLLLTDVLVPRAAVADWFGDLELPGLAALLAHARRVDEEAAQPDLQCTMPATRWLAHAFGIAASSDRAPLAAAWNALHDAPCDEHTWLADPVHFALARDHVMLGEHRPSIDEREARELAHAARPIVEGAGGRLLTPTPSRWSISHPQLGEGLRAADPLRAYMRNVEPWLPGGDDGAARLWRRMHTEIQMAWHEHPVNQAREARGERPINALWLWGAAALRTRADAAPYEVVGETSWVARGFACLTQAAATNASIPLHVHDELALPAAQEDVAGWRDALQRLDAQLFVALARARRPIALTCCGETTWRSYEIRGGRSWRFWERRAVREALSV